MALYKIGRPRLTALKPRALFWARNETQGRGKVLPILGREGKRESILLSAPRVPCGPILSLSATLVAQFTRPGGHYPPELPCGNLFRQSERYSERTCLSFRYSYVVSVHIWDSTTVSTFQEITSCLIRTRKKVIKRRLNSAPLQIGTWIVLHRRSIAE